MTNDIEGKVRKELNSVYAKGRSRGVFRQGQEVIDSALSSILSLTTKTELVPLDEVEVVYILNDRDPLGRRIHELLPEAIAHAICSHFSKPVIKYPEKNEPACYCKEHKGFDSECNYEKDLGYNQAIDDMRKLNREGGV